MNSTTLKKALVVASVALTLPVLGAGSAYADSSDGFHGKQGRKDSSSTRSTTHTDQSGSSTNPDGTFQGKSSSTPDQDGKGTDRGADNNDKTGPGTDGNNGCGNEPRLAAPRDGGRPTDDDNNGWCGSKPAPVHQAHKASAPVTAPPAPVVAPQLTPAVAPLTVPAAPAAVVGQGTVTALAVTAPAPTSRAGAVVGTAPSLGSGSVSAAGPLALPFTGAPVDLLLLLSLLAVGAGTAITMVGSRRTA